MWSVPVRPRTDGWPHGRTDLDARRGFAMLVGIAVHASLAFFAFPWPVHDTRRSGLLPLFLVAVHGFRMPLFFLLRGLFHDARLPPPRAREPAPAAAVLLVRYTMIGSLLNGPRVLATDGASRQ